MNIVPIDDSIYNWDGKIQSQPEFQLIIKTDVSRKTLIENFFKLNHSYELPEFIVIDFSDGSKEYLNWMKKNLYFDDN